MGTALREAPWLARQSGRGDLGLVALGYRGVDVVDPVGLRGLAT